MEGAHRGRASATGTAGPCGAVSLPDVLQWVALVDDNPARGAGVVLLQVLHQAAPADCEEAYPIREQHTIATPQPPGSTPQSAAASAPQVPKARPPTAQPTASLDRLGVWRQGDEEVRGRQGAGRRVLTTGPAAKILTSQPNRPETVFVHQSDQIQ